jgi:hypothetical protein
MCKVYVTVINLEVGVLQLFGILFKVVSCEVLDYKKQSRNRPGVAHTVPGGLGSQFS